MNSILLLNQNWFAEELRAYGYNVKTAGSAYWHDFKVSDPLPPIQTLLAYIRDQFEPDLIIYHDNSMIATCTGFADIDIPSIFYSVDTHHHSRWHSYYSRGFDAVIVAQKDYMGVMKEQNSNTHWLPLWCSVEYKYPGVRDIDVSFRGTLDKKLNPARVDFFDELCKLREIDVKMGQFKDTYTRSKIVINQAVGTDLNFRIFEALGSGAMLLTPELTNGFADLFENGRHLVTYEANNAEDANEKISQYLGDETLRKQIAAEGYEAARTDHTAFARAKALRKIILELRKSNPKQNATFGDAYVTATAAKQSGTSFPWFIEQMYVKAYGLLLKGVERGEEMDDQICLAAVLTAEGLLEYNRKQESMELCLVMSEAFPEREIFNYYSLVTMKEGGLSQEQILSFAKTKFSDPEAAASKAEDISKGFRVSGERC